ncbi:MAG: hypothetical protein AAB734_03745 [Patescibacteria group bacterium]
MGDDDGGLNVREESPYMPDLAPGPKISHYYGDYVRQIFMASAAIMLVFSPFLARTFPMALPFEIGGALIIAVLGALTNPARQMSLLANAIASGVGVVVYELLALNAFYSGAMIAFVEREALAIGFLFALYFSLKTLRNMVFHMVGRGDKYGDFLKEE